MFLFYWDKLNAHTSKYRVLAFVLLANISVAMAEDRLAYVLDVRGEWRIEHSSTDLARAAGVQEGSRIQHIGGSPQDYIVLEGLWDTPKRLSCSQTHVCDQPNEIVSSGREHRASQIYSVVMEIWKGQKSWDEGYTRGVELREAAVALRDGGLFLSPMFSGLPKDSYHLRIRRIEGGMATAKFVEINDSVVFNWDPDHPGPLAVDQLRPGLYEIGLMTPSPLGEYEYSGTSGWALACDAKASWCQENFEQAAALTNDWGESVRPIVKRNFLRAYMQRLSQDAK